MTILTTNFRTIVAVLASVTVLSFSGVSARETVRCLTEPVDDVLLSSIVEGAIAEIHFGEGSFVEKGEVVLELESRSEKLDIQRREVLVDTLKRTLERSEKLLASTSAISIEEVDTSRSDYQISVLELELAKDTLEKKRIRAPFSGMVTNLPIKVGEYCEPPQVLLRLVDPREFYCIANIDPVTATRLKIGDFVSFVAESRSDTDPLPGRIVFVSPVVDSASGLLRIKALFSNSSQTVRPGEAGVLELFPEL